MGIKQLYSHQAETVMRVRSGKGIVLVTSTASGKSMSYMIPIFETVMVDPKATALYIAPLNALVNDQLKSFLELRDEGHRFSFYHEFSHQYSATLPSSR